MPNAAQYSYYVNNVHPCPSTQQSLIKKSTCITQANDKDVMLITSTSRSMLQPASTRRILKLGHGTVHVCESVPLPCRVWSSEGRGRFTTHTSILSAFSRVI